MKNWDSLKIQEFKCANGDLGVLISCPNSEIYKEIVSLASSNIGILLAEFAYRVDSITVILDEPQAFKKVCFPTNKICKFIEKPDLIRVEKHRELIKGVGVGAASVALHSTHEPFAFLELYAKDKRRLNKQREEVLGKPATSISLAISEPRIWAIRKALANGQTETFQYTYEDDFFWKFKCTATPLHGTEEILIITHDDDGEEWQQKYWLNKRLVNN